MPGTDSDPSASPLGADVRPPEAIESAVETDGAKGKGKKLWTTESAREAAQKSAEVRRELARQRQRDEHGVLIARVPVRLQAIVNALERKAEKGDTQASRELRSWLADQKLESDQDPSTLSRLEREAVLRRLRAEIALDHIDPYTGGDLTPVLQAHAERWLAALVAECALATDEGEWHVSITRTDRSGRESTGRPPTPPSDEPPRAEES